MQIVAEIGLSHEGSLGRALAFIDAVAAAGVDAVKFQCHDGDRCQNFREGAFFPQDATRQDYWRRTSFIRSEWMHLSGYAHDKGVDFGCSVFAPEGIETLRGLVDFWKIPSSRATDWRLFETCRLTGKPLMVSTGMATDADIREIAERLDSTDTIMACVTSYPCTAEHAGFAIVDELGDEPGIRTGLSDHSGTIWPGLAATVIGFDVLEVHVCMSRHDFGPDISSSITIEELAQLVDGVRYIERMLASKLTREDLVKLTAENRKVFCGA